MDKSIDYIIAVGAIVIGIMLLTGHGAVFMKGGNEDLRKKLYDQKKMEKASGVALLVIGIFTGIDSFTTGAPAKIAYIVIMFAVFGALLYYYKVKCKLK